MPPTNKLTILFLAANPMDAGVVRADKEYKAISAALLASQYSARFDLRSEWAATYDILQNRLLHYMPHIVHFAGHGDESGQLLLMDADNKSKPVPTQALASLFAAIGDNIRCVVLNACYTEGQAQTIAQSVDFVVGMSDAFPDKAAADFAAGFYTGLGFGRTVRTALDMGCNRIDLAGIAGGDQPQLIARRSDPAKTVLIDPLTGLYAPTGGAGPARLSRLKELKAQSLHTRIDNFLQQWMAVDKELSVNIDPATRATLRLRLTQLEEDITKAEGELRALN